MFFSQGIQVVFVDVPSCAEQAMPGRNVSGNSKKQNGDKQGKYSQQILLECAFFFIIFSLKRDDIR